MSTRARARSARPRARKGEGGRLREAILDAAERLLYERGSVEAVSIRDIAHRVGVTPPALYLHFADKDQLVYATCRRGFERFAAHLEPILAAEGPPIARLRRLGAAYVEYGLEQWQQYQVLFGSKPSMIIPPEWLEDDPGLRVLFGLVALVGDAIRAGEIRPELEPAAIAAFLWAAVHGTVEILLARRSAPHLVLVPEEGSMVEVALDLLVDAVATPKGRRRLTSAAS